jgi:23S rRNA (guanosine2251-2'-O)-methyltransferase
VQLFVPERRSASVTSTAWKVSAGAAAHMPVARVVNLTKALQGLKENGYYVVGLDGGGDSTVGETGFEKDPLVVVLGSEGSGLSRLVRENCDAISGIPITNMVESLNASVAAGISLYAVANARRKAAAAL